MMASKIIINTKRCKGCGLCVLACTKECISITKEPNQSGYFPAQTNNIGCTACTLCAIICPDAVIEVYRNGTSAAKPKKTGVLAEEKT